MLTAMSGFLAMQQQGSGSMSMTHITIKTIQTSVILVDIWSHVDAPKQHRAIAFYIVGPRGMRSRELILPLTLCSTSESGSHTLPGQHRRIGPGGMSPGELALPLNSVGELAQRA